MSGQLAELLGSALTPVTRASTTAGARLGPVLAAVAAPVTVVVSGRRGVGKTTVVDALAPRFAARLVELPDVPPAACAESLRVTAEVHPDLLIHVAQQDLRSDELELLRGATSAWRLSPVDVVVLLLEPVAEADGAGTQARLTALAGRLGATGRHLVGQVVATASPGAAGDPFAALHAAVERHGDFVEARRVGEALALAAELVATQADAPWAADLRDELERVALVPAAHVVRERWALHQVLSGTAHLAPELVTDLVDLYLPNRGSGDTSSAAERRAALVERASRWRTEANRLAPLPAEVARVAVETCRMRLTGPVQHVGPIQPHRLASVPDAAQEVRHG
jgi:hypothetical protein